MAPNILNPVFALICWSLVMWIALYATRISGMNKLGLKAGELKEKSDLDVLPRSIRQVADNYNHLHEQPTIFYALAFYSVLAGTVDSFMVTTAWVYVGLRVAHSIFQATINFVPVRFVLFILSSLCLFAIVGRNLMAM